VVVVVVVCGSRFSSGCLGGVSGHLLVGIPTTVAYSCLLDRLNSGRNFGIRMVGLRRRTIGTAQAQLHPPIGTLEYWETPPYHLSTVYRLTRGPCNQFFAQRRQAPFPFKSRQLIFLLHHIPVQCNFHRYVRIIQYRVAKKWTRKETKRL